MNKEKMKICKKNLQKKKNKLIRQFEADKEEKTNLNNKEYTEKINFIENNIFFEYLVNITLIKGKANPVNIDFEYQKSKVQYEQLLEEFLSFIETDINFNKNNGSKGSFIDFINKLTKTSTAVNYDINQAISKLELMHYIEQADYLKLLSKYSKLNDIYLKLNSLEEEIGLPTTNKPIILIVIENLFINSQSNVTYDINQNNISTMHQGFGNNRNVGIGSDPNSKLGAMYSNLEEKNKKIDIKQEENIVFFKQNDGSLLNPSNFVRGDFILINTEKK